MTERAAQQTAAVLLDTGAVAVNAETPFTFTSGTLSPVYIDCRRPISFLAARREIISLAAKKLKAACNLDEIDYIAGGETAGIPYAAWISDALDKPMLYVRKKPKGFGRCAQIEGHFDEGARVLLVEDLASEGGSKVAFAKTLRAAGAVISDVFAVFFYGIYPNSTKLLADAGLTLHALATWHDVLAEMKSRSSFAAADIAAIEAFIADPENWGQKGKISA